MDGDPGCRFPTIKPGPVGNIRLPHCIISRTGEAVAGGSHGGRRSGLQHTARVLHWFTAVLVLITIPAGIAMANIGAGPLQNFLFDLHRSIGVLLIPVILLRLAYRLHDAPPPLPADIPAIQQFAASSVHVALYALLIVQPIVGWVGTSAFRAPIDCVLAVRAAADLAGESGFLRSGFPGAPSHRLPDRAPALRPHRRRAVSSFRAARPRAAQDVVRRQIVRSAPLRRGRQHRLAANEISCALGHHQHAGIDVCGDEVGHRGGIDHAQLLDAAHL